MQAVDVGQAQVEDDDVGLAGRGLDRAALAGRGLVAAITAAAEGGPEEATNLWLVLDQHHDRGRRADPGRRQVRGHQTRLAPGTRPAQEACPSRAGRSGGRPHRRGGSPPRSVRRAPGASPGRWPSRARRPAPTGPGPPACTSLRCGPPPPPPPLPPRLPPRPPPRPPPT